MWQPYAQALDVLHHLIYYLLFGSPAFALQVPVWLLHGFWERCGRMLDYTVPLLLLLTCALALRKKENVYERLLEGGAEGLRLILSLIPTLVMLLTSVSMLRASGAIDLLSSLLSPIFHFFGIPPETALLVLIRPISGSAALAAGAELMAQYGVDSQVGRTAAVMLGSTETTFYTISVYFGAAGIKKSRCTIPAALIADFTGFFMASLCVRLWM